MIDNIIELRKKLESFYPQITDSCKNCNFPDCKGYIYMLEEELDQLIENDIPVLCVNNNIYLLNNFKEKNDSFDLTEISPKCKLRCQDGMCSIQNIKPLVCLFYPIIIEKYVDGKHYWSLHKQCQYYVDLKKSGQIEIIINKFNDLINSLSPELYEKIVTTYFNYDSIMITEYTDFDIKIFREVKKTNVKEVKNNVKV